jgi:hypothetical protein
LKRLPNTLFAEEMRHWLALALTILVVGCGEKELPKSTTEMTDSEEPKGVIGRTIENELPVIYKFVNESPSNEKREALPWLMIISWKYDGASNNGMPLRDVNDRMIALEEAIEGEVVATDFCEHAVSRTGNNLKELIYYINDRDTFSEKLNDALRDHDRHPIEITFFEDKEWKEFENTRADFNKSGEQDVDPIA